MLLFLSIIENVCHGIHQYESAHVNFKEFLYFALFSSVTSAALNIIQISYVISYFRHRDSSDIFTYDIARQSVVNKIVREISLEVREKSGKSQGILFSHFCGNPVLMKPPFEPMNMASLADMTRKLAFLLALDSAKRNSEVWAFSADVRFGQDYNTATLSFLPNFLAKTMDPSRPETDYAPSCHDPSIRPFYGRGSP